MRVLSAGVCSRAAAAAGSARSSDAAASLLSLLPHELTTALPAEALLGTTMQVATAAIAVLQSSKLPMAMQSSAASSSSSSSSSSSNAADPDPVGQQYIPFAVSLLLTALKCASALRGVCPKGALDVAASIGRHRIECCVSAEHTAWLQQQAAATPAAELQRLLSEIDAAALRSLLLRLTTAAAMTPNGAAPANVGRAGAVDVAAASDSELQELLQKSHVGDLRTLVIWSQQLQAGNGAANEEMLQTGRRIGHWRAAAAAIAAGPPVTFRPGGLDSSSSSSSSTMWYTAQMGLSMTPWLTVAARSMWLVGQLLSELLLASSSSSRSASLACPATEEEMDESFFAMLLEMAYTCVEWLGWQLCHMQLPGDQAPTLASSSSSSSLADVAASMPLLTQLLQQHAQLQAGMYAAVQRCAAGPSSTQRHGSSDATACLQRVWGEQLLAQLRAVGAAVAAALPVGWACNNAACTNLGKLSELQLVSGRGKVCSGCRQVRVCSAECQKQHWKAGHRLVCKNLAAVASAGKGNSTAASSSSAAATSSSGSANACSRGTGSAGAAAAAAGLELPCSAVAAAALPVRQLKALLAALGVAGLAGAVEKSDLVGLLVGHLSLS
uniref:phytol kinase n=1 Tax=Tetradesmus obliquus TaxID=3088 RepID=A0A383VPY6_TETOB|eukprot:jgi/Sobl393_1/2542/SZX67575.1